jgi:hypothetical protein
MCNCAVQAEVKIQSDSTLLSGFPWTINGNLDNNLELSCVAYKDHSKR